MRREGGFLLKHQCSLLSFVIDTLCSTNSKFRNPSTHQSGQNHRKASILSYQRHLFIQIHSRQNNEGTLLIQKQKLCACLVMSYSKPKFPIPSINLSFPVKIFVTNFSLGIKFFSFRIKWNGLINYLIYKYYKSDE